jgi:hypothetical protein
MSTGTPDTATGASRRRALFAPAAVLALGVIWTSFYVNSSFSVVRPETYRFFPPFRVGEDRNWNDHLGAEYFSIARSLYEGRGFANPFRQETGPTAWMPPVLPGLMATVLWASGGDRGAVVNAMICGQAVALIAAGWLTLVVARRTTNRINPWAVVAVYGVGLAGHFTLAFQQTHDSGLVLLVLTLTLAAACLGRPLRTGWGAAGWGLWGGVVALVGPVLGFVWAVLTAAEGVRQRSAVRFAIAATTAVLVVAPWAARNYQTFGRLIPVKSNLGFELYQSHCLEPDGVLRSERAFRHPYNPETADGRDYKRLGEVAFLDEKMAAFRASVEADPWALADKVFNRFLAATLVYVPADERREDDLYWGLWISRLTHALPFLSAVLLLATAPRFGLRREQGAVLLGYAAYLLPYVLVSYYDRYAFPLLTAKALLVLWAAERLAVLADRSSRLPSGPEEPCVRDLPPPGPKLHYWIAGLAVCGAVWWWYGGELLDRMSGAKTDRNGSKVLVPDFYQEWYSARLWWQELPPYSRQAEWHAHLHLPSEVDGWFLDRNAHPPGAVFLALPLGQLGFTDALAVWNVMSVWCLILSVALVVAGLRCRVPGWAVLPAVTALVFTNPFWTQSLHGQLNLVILLLLVGAWSADRSGRPWLAGGLVGAAAVVKLFPGYLLVYFAARGQWRAAAAGVAAIAVGFGLTSATLGWDVWRVYFAEVLPHTREFAAAWTNASLPGWWLKLFDPLDWYAARPWPVVRSRGLAAAAGLLTAAALTALLWRRLRRAAPTPDRGFAAALVVMLLVSPITWDHYFLLLLLPVAVLWRDLPPGGSRAVFWAVLVVMAVSPYALAEAGMLLVGELPDWSRGGWESPPWLTATILSVHTYALITMLGLFMFVPARCAEVVHGSGELVSAPRLCDR